MTIAAAAALIAIALWGIIDARRTGSTLNALRDNCFITNEKGHRVRYLAASKAMQRKAEAV